MLLPGLYRLTEGVDANKKSWETLIIEYDPATKNNLKTIDKDMHGLSMIEASLRNVLHLMHHYLNNELFHSLCKLDQDQLFLSR